jgi:hypothetical protein
MLLFWHFRLINARYFAIVEEKAMVNYFREQQMIGPDPNLNM